MISRMLYSLLLMTSIFLSLLFMGEVKPPEVGPPLSPAQIENQSQFYDKKEHGIHHAFLSGNDYQRGQQFGYWTKHLLVEQERSLLRKLDEVFPNKILQYALFIFSMGWFNGLDDYFEEHWKREMYGVTLHTPLDRLFFSTIYTRQLAYHGIHDMGQMMIDSGLVLGACTQLAVPKRQGWLIGRNFDFEAGPVFDEDKVIKWVFPDKGVPYVSVLFSGMVGVITGINKHGVYIALNAAGSDDYVRLGTPTNLIVYKALRNSKTAEQAVKIIKKTKSLITDIYVVADKGSEIYIVEKSPKKVAVRTSKKSEAITNHFEHALWQHDNNNLRRQRTTTTLDRKKRGTQLLEYIQANPTPNTMLTALRDKYTPEGVKVPGHRSAIDALISSHSVIYDSEKSQLFVSSGGSLTKAFYGYDLKKSFQWKKPVLVGKLPEDPDVKPDQRYSIKMALKVLDGARLLAKNKKCELAEQSFASVPHQIIPNHYKWDWTYGDVLACKGNIDLAIESWEKALNNYPAYTRERELIERSIRGEN